MFERLPESLKKGLMWSAPGCELIVSKVSFTVSGVSLGCWSDGFRICWLGILWQRKVVSFIMYHVFILLQNFTSKDNLIFMAFLRGKHCGQTSVCTDAESINSPLRQREAFGNVGRSEKGGAWKVQVVPAGPWCFGGAPTHPREPTGEGQHLWPGGPDGADLHRKVCGGDQEGFKEN